MISDNKEVLDFVDRLVRIDRLGAEKIFNTVCGQGSMSRTVDQLILPALEVIGNGWEKGTVALAQVYMSSRICEELMTHVPPSSVPKYPDHPPMAIAVLEDYHLLGKIIISACLRAGGYSFLDYGRVTPHELAEKIVADSIEIVLISYQQNPRLPCYPISLLNISPEQRPSTACRKGKYFCTLC
ncbi:MAG: hypothetical protein D3906_18375, partial [Candidatus Electrothrix sp. AUS1_2]|nr:hypothetical protein [Candidatus Electrothrix sp. AUS1_2]